MRTCGVDTNQRHLARDIKEQMKLGFHSAFTRIGAYSAQTSRRFAVPMRALGLALPLGAALALTSCTGGGGLDSGAIRTTDNNGPDRAQVAVARYREPVQRMFASKGVDFSQPVFMRAFKQDNVIELWAKDKRRSGYKLVKRYEVCNYSGALGPKTRSGDMQTPEGFYEVRAHNLKPQSQFHMSFNLGFPNAHDRSRGWAGTNIMVHGDCTSEGCFAMRDDPMEEIYTVASLNFEAGNGLFYFHSFPFRMTDKALEAQKDHPWHDFWASMQPGYEIFERQRLVPQISSQSGRYIAALPVDSDAQTASN